MEDKLIQLLKLCLVRETIGPGRRQAIELDEATVDWAIRTMTSLRCNMEQIRLGVLDIDFPTHSYLAGLLKSISLSIRNNLEKIQALENDIKELKECEERWRLAIECSRDGVFDFSCGENQGSNNFVSRPLVEMQEMENIEEPSLEQFCAWVHPEDLRAKDLFESLAKGNYPKDLYDVTFRFRTGKGDYAWRRVRGRVFRDDNGAIVRTVGILEDIHARKEQQDSYMYRATHDPLTGLPNRALFQQHLERMLAIKAIDKSSCLLIAIVDLDYFKQVNDTMGHATGDILLKEFATRLKSSIREQDMAARLGGDEFAMILSCGCDSANHIAAISRIRASLIPAVWLDDNPYIISASIGIAVAPIDGLDPMLLIKRADEALYKVKRAGRNGFRFYADSNDLLENA